MKTVKGRRILDVARAEFERLRLGAREVLVDVGTGDGAFVWRYAREHSDSFAIGLDPVAENMAASSARIDRKPARGGARNMLFAVGSIENPPEELLGLAGRLTVHFPWGSLLRGLVAPGDDALVLINLARLAARPCRLAMLLNATLFEQTRLLDRLDLPAVTEGYVDEVLAPAYLARGLAIRERRTIGAGRLPARTTWGQRLSLGSRRETLYLEADVL